ncbi:ATP-binding protein [Cryptosporangium arvum]|uniref:ATP-binding protein n=1 Tax=Cryptosporangium arvum TaxID=80871 RepID=UPI001B80147B|nr:ATP-binding protein [Cryptosporangium arvum]
MAGDEAVTGLSARELAAEYAAGTPFDLAQCLTEPIHLLGGIQPYGALLAVREPDLTIELASRNAAGILGARRGDHLGDLLADAGPLRDALARLADGSSAVVRVRTTTGAPFDATVHRADGLAVVEFEPAAPPASTPLYPGVRDALARLRGARTATELCAAAVREIRALTGYERVVAYRFAGEGPGQVIAEDVRPDWASWLGLWFPASDVPPQARRLYVRNWIRLIGDVADESVALDPPLLPGTDRPLDLSGSVLRTVSGYHLDYLRNIEVAASMSVSLIDDGRLWGLLACHDSRPRWLDPEVRAACEFLGAALSLQLAVVDEREAASALAGRRGELNTLVHTDVEAFPGAVVHGPVSMADLVDADGCLIRVGDTTESAGLVPPDPDPILSAAGRGTGRVWASDCLREAVPGAGHDDVAGAMVVPLTDSGDYLAWFRREQPVDRRWAVDPERPVVTGPGGRRLTPRGSSTVWRETVRGTSVAWTTGDRDIAAEFWRSIAAVQLRHAAHLAELNAELSARNADLDAFSYAVSHDLKEPLRGIANYATFVLEDADEGLDDESRRRLTTIQRLAGRMNDLLNGLLDFAQLGASAVTAQPVDMDGVVDDALETLAPRLAAAPVEIVRAGPLPPAGGDPVLILDVLVNLLSNAIKYGGDRIEIGARDGAFYVRDNGIGIDPVFHGEIFKIFRRLHARGSRYEGAGVGLAVARRIVERHGGQLRVDSEPGRGSTFWFTLPPSSAST